MNFDELGTVWRRDGEPDPAGAARRLEAARAKAEEIGRAVRRRDRFETIAAFALVPVFGWMAFSAPSWLSALGAAIVAVACVVIPIRLRAARRAAPDRGLPAARLVETELDAIRAQQRLLGSVAWWYLTPLGLGVILVFAGAPVPAWTKVAYGAAVIALYVWLLRLNLHAVRETLEPVAQDLERWLDSFREHYREGASDAS